jgi:hypothetical protein
MSAGLITKVSYLTLPLTIFRYLPKKALRFNQIRQYFPVWMISFIINCIVLQDGADVGLITKVVSHRDASTNNHRARLSLFDEFYSKFSY